MHAGGGRPSGGPRQPLSGAGAADSAAPGAEPGLISDYHRRLRRAAAVPADAAADREVLYLRTWASGPAVARLALPPGRGSIAATEDQPGPDETGTVVPYLAAGVEPIGEYQGSGLAESTYLVRNAGGQVVHLSRLLCLVVSAIDGRRTVSEVAEQVTAGFGRTVSAGNIEYLLANKLLPLGLLAVADPAAAGPPGPAAALLALKLRRTIVTEPGVQFLARLFRPLFRPVVVALMLTALIASDAWLFGSGRARIRVPVRAAPPAAAAPGPRPVRGLHAVPRVRSRRRLPVRRRASRRHRHGHLRDLARVLHQRHRRLPAGPGLPDPYRPGRRLLQRDLRAPADRGLPGHGLRAAGRRGRADPPGDRPATAAVPAVRRVLHPGRPDRPARPVPPDRAHAAQPDPRPVGRSPAGQAQALGPGLADHLGPDRRAHARPAARVRRS